MMGEMAAFEGLIGGPSRHDLEGEGEAPAEPRSTGDSVRSLALPVLKLDLKILATVQQ